MDLDLVGKNVIITAASRGIGRATALEFAKEGANVAICARGQESLLKTRDELAKVGVNVFAECCDVSDLDSLDSFLESSHDFLGGVDVLVNNASGFGMGNSEEAWKQNFEVDCLATVRATSKVVPWMSAQKSGSIIYVSSISAFDSAGIPGIEPMIAYSSAKLAMIGHAKSSAVSLAKHGIRVNCVVPGAIEFPGGSWERIKTDNPEVYESFLSTVPMGRFGTDTEVAAVIAFLASPRASYVSGASLRVDGATIKSTVL